MRNTNVDQLVMLLSTDWFLPYWAAIRVEPGGDTKAFIQQGCREIVRQFMGEYEQYYSISFAQQRTTETERQFAALLQRANTPQKMSDTLSHFLSLDPESSSTRWMVTITTNMLVTRHQSLPTDEDVPALGGAITDLLARWYKQQPKRVEFGPICLGSTTDWDTYIRNLTPELPACLADYAQVSLIDDLSFGDLRNALGQLTPSQRRQLEEWYSVIIRKLTRTDEVSTRVTAVLSNEHYHPH